MSMALTAHQELQRRKQQKFKRELERAVTNVPPHKLGNLAELLFREYPYKPSLSSLVQMVMTSKFGGEGNAISDGGAAFMLGAVVRALNNLRSTRRLTEQDESEWGTYFLARGDMRKAFNGLFLFDLDKSLVNEWHALEATDFEWATDISPYLFLDRETQAFGLVIVPYPSFAFGEIDSISNEAGLDLIGIEKFTKHVRARLLLPRPRFDSGHMDYVSLVLATFGTTDKLIASLPDRQKHDVKAHTRTYQSGVVAHIAPQKRRNPLRLVVQNDLLKDHIVYQVKDADGQVRYIGEGKSDRWKHVNSGVSHNFKINEHRFVRGEMDVSVLYEGLTKTEALSIEKALLKKHAGAGLWNTKDYEPFTENNGRFITDQEIEEYLNRPHLH
jgi:hypothetical protein